MTSTDLAPSPALYPIALDARGRSVQLLALSEADYRASSFLDLRLLTPDVETTWRAWADLVNAADRAPTHRHYLFHIGHVGSTLVSRLLGEHPALFCVREPAILRDLAHRRAGDPPTPAEAQAWATDATVFVRLWSRVWRPEQTAVIKATSLVSAIADELLTQSPTARAIFMFTSPLAYIRSIFGGPSSRTELRLVAADRLARVQRRFGPQGWMLDDMSEGEVVAMTWLCEITALLDAAASRADAVLWIDFDRFLAAPAAVLTKTLTHLQVAADPTFVQTVLNGPIMRRYSKGPEHAYDAQLRQDVLIEAEYAHGAEIRKGMDWLSRAGRAVPEIRAAIEASARVGR